MSKPKSGPLPAPTPVVLVVLPDKLAREIHRKLTQLENLESDPAAPRPRRASAPRAGRPSATILTAA
jgi:hypothetical protein